MVHCSYFRYEVKAKGRSRIVESISSRRARGEVRNPLLVLVSVERRDEDDLSSACQRAADEVSKQCERLGLKSIVLHSFAHLFAELSSPQAALEAMVELEKILSDRGYWVVRTPFGGSMKLSLRPEATHCLG